MDRFLATVAVADVLALLALYEVVQNLAAKASYVVNRELLSYATTYYPFIRFSHITGAGPVALVSPPSLDWVQVIILFLVVVNGACVVHLVRRHPGARTPGAGLNHSLSSGEQPSSTSPRSR